MGCFGSSRKGAGTDAFRYATSTRAADQPFSPPGGGDAQEEARTRFGNALNAYLRATQWRRAFYPDSIYKLVRELDKAAWKEGVDFESCIDLPATSDWSADSYSRAEENREAISAAAESLIAAIRERIVSWSPID